MATVWKHPNSPFWSAVYRDEDCRWRKRSTKLKERSKALQLALEWERAAEMGRNATLTEAKSREIIGGILERTTGESLRKETVRQFCARWLAGKESSRRAGTSTRYAGCIDRFLKFLGKRADRPIDAITPSDCQRYYDHLGEYNLAPATKVVEIKTISGVFNRARRLGLIETNPVEAVELPSRIRQVKRKTFTTTQVNMLLKEASDEWRTAILLSYYAGLRISDATTLTWDKIDLAGRRIVVDEIVKTGDDLTVPMHPVLEAHLLSIAGDSMGPLCPTLSEVPTSGRSGLSKQFLAIMRQAGIDNAPTQTGGQRKLSRLSHHALRNTFNSTLHNQGVDQELRKKLTGQKSNSVNDRYTETQLSTLRGAVEKLPHLKA